jgi:PIN domain nuclease of toxin-antitoxin system
MLGVDVDLVMKGVLTNPYLTRSCSTPWSDLVSAVSCWQVAMLVNRGRLAHRLDMERWLTLMASHPAVRLHVVDPAVVVAATRLPEPFHAR